MSALLLPQLVDFLMLTISGGEIDGVELAKSLSRCSFRSVSAVGARKINKKDI